VSERIVLDASIAVTRLQRQSGVTDVNVRLRGWLADGTRLIVPASFWLEVSNSLIRRHRVRGALLIEAVHDLDDLGLETIDLDRPLLLLAIDRAERFGLTTYDAAYLALAETLDARLYSTDRELLGAAGSRGLGLNDETEHGLSEVRAPYGVEHRPTWPDYGGASSYLAQLRAEASRPT
jgi:predicted nucleic acid-binding protein